MLPVLVMVSMLPPEMPIPLLPPLIVPELLIDVIVLEPAFRMATLPEEIVPVFTRLMMLLPLGTAFVPLLMAYVPVESLVFNCPLLVRVLMLLWLATAIELAGAIKIEPPLLTVKLQSDESFVCVALSAVLIVVSPPQIPHALLWANEKPTPSAMTDMNALNLDARIGVVLVSKKFCCLEGATAVRWARCLGRNR